MAEYIDRNLCELLAEYDQYYTLVVPLSKIRKLPAADVAPVVHGKWIEEKYETISIERHRKINNIKNKCSICEKSNGRRKTNFCPNCGAKMDL